MEEVKILKTIVRSENGVVFENFPVYHYNGEDHFVMRDDELARQIEDNIPENIRHAVRVDCSLIPGFQEELDKAPPTEREKRILDWLDDMTSKP